MIRRVTLGIVICALGSIASLLLERAVPAQWKGEVNYFTGFMVGMLYEIAFLRD